MRTQPDVPDNPKSTNNVIETDRNKAEMLSRNMMLAGHCNRNMIVYVGGSGAELPTTRYVTGKISNGWQL
jgi:hypothetical protein